MISISKGSFSWDRDAEPVLHSIDFDLFPGLPFFSTLYTCLIAGKLVCVIGESGSGKSSLLASMLGELYLKNGNVSSPGSIAYVAQVTPSLLCLN